MPAEAAVTTPVVYTTLAIPGELLVQKPPSVSFDKDEVLPAHIDADPIIAAGNGLTVRIAVRVQPVPIV